MEEKKTSKFVLRIDSELKKKLEIAAKNDDRSLNGHIVSLIKQSLNVK